MTKELWINLPVKNVIKSKEFFTKIGFSFADGPGNTNVSATLVIGEKNIVIMLFEELVFKNFTGNQITDTKQATEVLFSISAETREEVDEWADKARNAGGIVYGKPSEHQGWLYGCGFADLDGHRWNVLYRDMSKMP